MALVKHRNSGRYHAPSENEQDKARAGMSLRVIRVILIVRRSLPVYPDKQTISEPVGTSHLCQQRSHVVRGQMRA
jgi:hypothetical protein